MATFEEVLVLVCEIISEVTGVPTTDVDLSKSLTDDLDLDSLAVAEVAVAVGDRFSIHIPDDAISGLRTVGDIVTHVVNTQS